MIDFDSKKVFKLKSDEDYAQKVANLLGVDECVVGAYSSGRDGMVFTTKRIIAINVQGITGKKKDFTSIPYNKITVFSLETAGGFDRDAELQLHLSGLGKLEFEFSGKCNIEEISKCIASYIN